VLDALHVPKDIHTISLVQPTVDPVSVRGPGRLGDRLARLEKENIRSRVLCAEVDVAEDARSDAGFGTVEDQIGIDVDDGRALEDPLAWYLCQSQQMSSASSSLIPLRWVSR